MIYVSLPYTITIFNCIIDIYIIKLALLSCALIELQTDRVAMLIFEISVIVERIEPIETEELKRFPISLLLSPPHILIYTTFIKD